MATRLNSRLTSRLAGEALGPAGACTLRASLFRGLRKEAPRAMPKTAKIYDALVVGSGASGGWVAKERAFQYLERAFAERTDYLIFLGREPLSDPVRADPRFGALLRRLGLPH